MSVRNLSGGIMPFFLKKNNNLKRRRLFIFSHEFVFLFFPPDLSSHAVEMLQQILE